MKLFHIDSTVKREAIEEVVEAKTTWKHIELRAENPHPHHLLAFVAARQGTVPEPPRPPNRLLAYSAALTGDSP